MPERPDVPLPWVERLRAVLGTFPQCVEEPAWTGVRWRVGGATVAHVFGGEDQVFSAQLSDTARALRCLSDEQREALILVGAGGFSYEDAAGICKCAVGTVKSQSSPALAKLRVHPDLVHHSVRLGDPR